MDQHRTIVPDIHDIIELDDNGTTISTINTVNSSSNSNANLITNNANRNSINNKSILKKANVIINTTFPTPNEATFKNHTNILKSRPKSAAPRIMQRHNYEHDTLTKYKLMTSNNNKIRPNTAKASFNSASISSSAIPNFNDHVPVRHLNLTFNLPAKQPTLLERYWKYNRVKKGEILTNRFFDNDEGRLYVLCTESYLQNAPKLIRQRPKSGSKQNSVTFSNSDNTKKLNLDSDDCSEISSNYFNRNSINNDKDEVLSLRSSLKSAQQKRRCVSATPRLFKNNNNNLLKIKDENDNTNEINDNNEIHNHDENTHENNSSNSNSNNHVTINAPENNIEITNDDKLNHHEHKVTELGDEIESEFDAKVKELLKAKSDKATSRPTRGFSATTRLLGAINEDKTNKSRPKSAISVTSSATSNDKKQYSVAHFNQFKNKLIDRKVYNQKQYENLDHVYNDWLHKPIPDNKKYIAGKYSVEMKRINYANYIRKRQLFLSESLCIKKLNINVQ